MKTRKQHSLAPVPINGTRIKPKNALHRKKLLALKHFAENLLQTTARDRIAKIVLFGSVARGNADADSDVDVIVFGFHDLKSIEEFVFHSAYDALLETREYISPLLEDATELFEPQSYLNYRVMRIGKEVFAVPEDALKQREVEDRKMLAEEYLRGAEDAYRNGHWRLAADGAYNAAEACAKGLLILKMEELPTTHTGIVQKFSEYFVKDGPAPRELGGRLNRGLIIRGDARYKPAAQIAKDSVEHNLNLAKEMIAFVGTILGSQS